MAATALHQEFRLYETDSMVVLITAGEGSEGIIIERSAPTKVTLVKSSTPVPPASRTRRTRKVYGVLGIIELGPGDARLLVVAQRSAVGAVPLPLYRCDAVEAVKLGREGGSGATATTASPDTAELARLLARFLAVPSLFVAYDWDATHTAQRRAAIPAEMRALPLWCRADQRFFWNSHLVRPLTDAGADRWVLPAFMGHAASTSVRVGGESLRLGIVSRRSRHMAGTRLFVRGVDALGNVANAVETEQLLICGSGDLASFVQVRGSIPVHWSQLPDLRYKPPPMLTARRDANAAASRAHFESLLATYGAPVHCVNLVDQKGKELVLANEYAACVRELMDAGLKVGYTVFDYHKEGSRKLPTLLAALDGTTRQIGFFLATATGGPDQQQVQSGVLRENCVDNLDRTNVVQSMIGRRVLETQLQRLGVFKSATESVPDHPQLFQVHKILWADNADVISTQYSGTGALKNDVTRTGKRTLRGMYDDGTNALVRYWKNNFTDGDLQDAYNFFLGHFVPSTTVTAAAPSTSASQQPPMFAAGANKLLGAALVFVLIVLLASLLYLPRIISKADFQSFVLVVLSYVAVLFAVMFTIRKHGRTLVNNPRLALAKNAMAVLAEKKSK
jgi:hypothetical protein